MALVTQTVFEALTNSVIKQQISLKAAHSIVSLAERIIEELVTIWRITRWTAEITVLRGLHRRDAFPVDD